jgi:hypothetical protein
LACRVVDGAFEDPDSVVIVRVGAGIAVDRPSSAASDGKAAAI